MQTIAWEISNALNLHFDDIYIPHISIYQRLYIILFRLSHVMRLRLFRTIFASSLSNCTFHQFSRKFSFPGKMNPNGNSSLHHEPVQADGLPVDVSTVAKGGYSHLRSQTLPQTTVDSVSKQPKCLSALDPAYEENWPSLSASISSGSKGKRRTKIDLRTQFDQGSEVGPGDIGSSQLETSPLANSTSQKYESSLPSSFGKKRVTPFRRHKVHRTFPAYAVGVGNSNSVEGLPALEPFDICFSKSRRSILLEPSVHAKNSGKGIEMEHSMQVPGQVVRPGMVLLKTYITLSEQVEIVMKCRELGLGPGGFYQPCYRDGAKLRLQMMCLGLNWDPETRKYEDRRQIDGSEPPGIPHGFSLLVERAIQASYALIKKDLSESSVEDILPGMSPNICIVNFYSNSGRLGLHQDRDESKESLLKGLPVVSFSIGDSAEFLYGDQRDVDKADKILLESGDVLIFGGMSRHIFHGVPSIIPNTAPPALLEEAKLRPGRLNLTFRKY